MKLSYGLLKILQTRDCMLVAIIQAACDLNNDQFDDETRTFIIDLLQNLMS